MIFVGNNVLSDRYQDQRGSRHSNLQISHPFPPFFSFFYWRWGSRPHLSILIFLLWHNHISKPFILFTRLRFWVTCLHSFLKLRGYLLFTLHFIIFTILTYFIMKEYVLLRIYISYLLLSNILAFHKLMCFSNRKDRINQRNERSEKTLLSDERYALPSLYIILALVAHSLFYYFRG